MKRETVRTEVIRVIGGGESAWTAVELRVTATTQYGEFAHRQSINQLGEESSPAACSPSLLIRL